MDGILKNNLTIKEAAARALEAGCDILLIGGRRLNERHQILSFDEIKEITQHLIACVKSGTIREQRIDEAFEKVYKIKQKLNKQKIVKPFDLKAHQALSDHIAQKAMFCNVKKNPSFLFNHFFLITSQDLKHKLTKIREDLSFLSGQFCFDQISVEDFTSQDLIIFLSNGLKKNTQDQEIYQKLLENKKTVILIDLTEQQQENKSAYGVIQTFSNQDTSLKLALNKVKEEIASSKTY
jgi:beta-glucosidase-like glycosyl hydrolase